MNEYEVILEKVGTGKRGAWYSVTFDGKILCVSRDPEFEACRELSALGLRGTLRTRWKGSPHHAMTLDILRDAGRKTEESPTKGLRTVKWQPWEDKA
jgi:hypothetical protein